MTFEFIYSLPETRSFVIDEDFVEEDMGEDDLLCLLDELIGENIIEHVFPDYSEIDESEYIEWAKKVIKRRETAK